MKIRSSIAEAAATPPTRNGPRSVGPAAPPAPTTSSAPPYKSVPTPGKRTIKDVCEFLGAEETTSAKLLVYLGDGKPVAALVRGDHELNEAKFRRSGRCIRPDPGRRSHNRESHRRAHGIPRTRRHQDSAL